MFYDRCESLAALHFGILHVASGKEQWTLATPSTVLAVSRAMTPVVNANSLTRADMRAATHACLLRKRVRCVWRSVGLDLLLVGRWRVRGGEGRSEGGGMQTNRRVRCGHARCYSCMFATETCPLCLKIGRFGLVIWSLHRFVTLRRASAWQLYEAVLPNGLILSFQNQWSCIWCISAAQIVNAFHITLTYLAASLRLFLVASEALPANGGLCKDQIGW